MGTSCSSLQVPRRETLKRDVQYNIEVETAQRVGAGTDAVVSLTVIGTTGETQAFKLGAWFQDDFRPGQIDEYTVEGEDVGCPIMIKLTQLHLIPSNDWLVNQVKIRKQVDGVLEEEFHFPCYRWVRSELVVFEGEALLPLDKQHYKLKKQRYLEIKQRQKLYNSIDNLKCTLNMPTYISAKDVKSLPKDVQFTDEAHEGLFRYNRRGLSNLGLADFFNVCESWDDFDDYRKPLLEKTFKAFVRDVPIAADYWREDTWYGQQFLNGSNPDTMERCTEIPLNFPVTDEIVGDQLEGMTLSQAVEAGRIYMVDYKILKDVPHYGENDPEVERRYTSASMGLFYVRNNGDLVPIAIQLHQEPSDTNPIWTPNDTEYDWLFAKMWLRNADTQYHELITRLLRCHLMMEPICLATWRQLPSLHPIWKLLCPHIKGIFAINSLYRTLLIAAGGGIDQTLSIGAGGHILLMQKYYKSITWESYDLPLILRERGVNDPEKLPKFYYRDDALSLWNAILKFVKEILVIYYSTDSDVCEDSEIQNWIREISERGYPAMTHGSVDKGLPSSFKTREYLAHFLTTVIFTCSCQHAAVNFSQMDTYGFSPNSPSIMRKPPPTEKGKVDLKYIMDTLPTKHQASINLAIMHDQTRSYPAEQYLGDFSEGQFIDDPALEAISRFQENLKRISGLIQERNKSLDVPYTYLLPERITNSISI